MSTIRYKFLIFYSVHTIFHIEHETVDNSTVDWQIAVGRLATFSLVSNFFGPGLNVDTDNEHVTCQQIGASHVKMNNRNKGTIYKTS